MSKESKSKKEMLKKKYRDKSASEIIDAAVSKSTKSKKERNSKFITK